MKIKSSKNKIIILLIVLSIIGFIFVIKSNISILESNPLVEYNKILPIPPSVNSSSSLLESVTNNSGAQTINGWACFPEKSEYIEIHLYFGLLPEQLKGGVADKIYKVRKEKATVINKICKEKEKAYQFNISLSDLENRRFAGQTIHAYAVLSPKPYLMEGSGLYSLPALEEVEVDCNTWDGIVDKNIKLKSGCNFNRQVFFSKPNVKLNCNGGTIDGTGLDFSDEVKKQKDYSTRGQAIGILSSRQECLDSRDPQKIYFPDPDVSGAIVENCNIVGSTQGGNNRFFMGIYLQRYIWKKIENNRCLKLGEFPLSQQSNPMNIDTYLGGRENRYKFHPRDVTMRNVSVKNVASDGIFVNEYAQNWLIEDSVSEYNNKGIYLERESKNNIVANSKLNNNRFVGLAIDASANNIIDRNDIYNNRHSGIEIYKNCGERQNGVTRYQHANNNIIRRNSIRGHLDQPTPYTLTLKHFDDNKDFTGKGIGIWVGARQGLISDVVWNIAQQPERASEDWCSDGSIAYEGRYYAKDFASGNKITYNYFSDNGLANVFVEDDNNSITNNTFSSTREIGADVFIGSLFRTLPVGLGPVSGVTVKDNKSTSKVRYGNYVPYFNSSREGNSIQE